MAWLIVAVIVLGMSGLAIAVVAVTGLVRLHRAGGIKLSFYHKRTGKWSDQEAGKKAPESDSKDP